MANSPHKPSDGGRSKTPENCDRLSKRGDNKDDNRGHPARGTCCALDPVQGLYIYLSCELGTVVKPVLQLGKQRLGKLAQGPLAPKGGIRI